MSSLTTEAVSLVQKKPCYLLPHSPSRGSLWKPLGRFLRAPPPLRRVRQVRSVLRRDKQSMALMTAASFFWVLSSSAIERACEFSQRTLGTDIRMRLSNYLLR